MHVTIYQVFDEIRIEDPRVAEFSAKTTEPLPHSVLMTCLQRNYGIGDMDIDYQVNTTKHKKNEFTMTVGKHKVSINCKNKREGKHRASQSILKVIYYVSGFRSFPHKSFKQQTNIPMTCLS